MAKKAKLPQIFLKRAKKSFIPIIFKGVLYQVCTYTVTVSYHSLYMNQVPEKFYQVHDFIALMFIQPLY